ncbi:hypothetical protein HK102_012335 [Quaeritorhiza haematococci]|nr:hypothetical protein HK102_012335 [Quaeritorhiza haematococci]
MKISVAKRLPPSFLLYLTHVPGTFVCKASIVGEATITIVAARNLKPVDSNGLSDPYIKVVQMYHGKSRTVHKTSVVKKTLNPAFSKETFNTKLPPSHLRLVVKDHNTFGESKDLGEVEVDLLAVLGDKVPQDSSPASPFNVKFDVSLPIGMGGTGEVQLTGEVRGYISGNGSAGSSGSQEGGGGHRRSASVESTELPGTPGSGSPADRSKRPFGSLRALAKGLGKDQSKE